MHKPTLLAALSINLAASLFVSASARDIEYHPYEQPVILCQAAMLCEIVLDRNEHVHRAFSSQAGQWEPNLAVEGDSGSWRPSLVLKPEASNLVANFMVFTDRRTYHFEVRSVDGPAPYITRILFDDVQRAFAKSHPPVPRRQTTRGVLAQLTPEQQLQHRIDEAVAYTAAHGETYGTDPQPADYRIVRVAHSVDHTFIQFVHLDTVPSTVPQIMDTENGAKVVENRYDPALRVYVIDNVSREYTLQMPDGKKTRAVRVQRQVSRELAKSGR